MTRHKTSSRLLAILLSLILVIGIMPVAVAYAQEISGEGYSFNTETGELYIETDAGSTNWRNDPDIKKEDVKSVEIQFHQNPVLHLGESAFDGCVNLTGTIKLNADTASIGANAFRGCEKLDQIFIPKAVEGDVAAAGIPQNVAYVIYEYDRETSFTNLYVWDVHYGDQEQVTFDGRIADGGIMPVGIDVICDERFPVVPVKDAGAWYYRTEADGTITVTEFIRTQSMGRSETITLPKSFGDLVVKEYAEDAFTDADLTAEAVLIVDEGIKATIPEKVSKMLLKTENGNKVAYLTEGTSGSIDQSLHFLNVPRDVNTLFMKDIMASSYNLMLMECNAVSYTEDAGGKIVITNVLLGHIMWDQQYIVPTTVENKPVTTVMINSMYNHGMDQIIVDESVNKIIYESDPYSDSNSCTITQIVQGSNQTNVEIPDVIGENPVESVPETAFDESVESIIVPEGLEVAQPEDVCKIVYTTDSDGKVLITDIVPGKNDSGETKPVTVPGSIAGQTPVVSDEVKEEMEKVPHEHTGGTASCTEPAKCQICGQYYGETDETNHSELVHVAKKDPTCTVAGNIEYWTCKECGKYFSNAEGKTEIKLDDTVIAAKGHSYENGVCTVCGVKDPDYEAPVVPAIITGANGVWQTDSNEDLSFTSNADFDDFIKVQVDGKDLDSAHYTLREGSTIVTLKPEYLKTLAGGKHTLAIVSETGTATTEFTIKSATIVDGDTESPQTGDDSNIALWTTLLLSSIGALSMMFVVNKRKTAKNR